MLPLQNRARSLRTDSMWTFPIVGPYPYYRQENWDSTLRLYYDAFNATLRAMSVEGADVTYEEFLLDVKASIPISLFFCGNIQGWTS